MRRSLLAIFLIALATQALAQDAYTTTASQGCACGACPNNGGSVPVNQPIIIATPPTIAPPACAIPQVNTPVIAPPTVSVPTINAPCIDVPTLNAPQVVAPPTVTPPTPVIPVVTPPSYTPPSLPPQVPPPSQQPTMPNVPVITLPTPPPMNCNTGSLSNQFTLSFEYACRPGVSFQSCLGEVVWNNAIILSIVPSDYVFHTATLSVSAQVGQNALQFVGAGISDSYGLLIDNVKLIRSGSTANIVVNGDFSAPNVHLSWGIFNDISGWKGIGIEVGYGPNAYGLGSSQVCELDGNGNYEITQYFTFDNQFNQISNSVAACNNPFPGNTLTYKLEFDWAVRTVGISNTDSSKANVLWNNVVIGSLQYNGNNGVNHATFSVTLNAGDNILQFDATSFSDSYGITFDNVKLTSAYNSTNLIVNGDFSSPYVGNGWSYFNGGVYGWSAVKAEVGGSGNYNPNWPAGTQVAELDSDSNQRYTQVITISQSLYSQLILQIRQITGTGQVVSATNLAINNAQNSVNTQIANINSAVQCATTFLVAHFNQYLRNLYQCNTAQIQNVLSNELVTIKQYSCGASQWIQYFGQSGELDFDCDADEVGLSSGWCTLIAINGKVLHCRNSQGNYHLQIAPCSHLEGPHDLPVIGHNVYWKGTQSSCGNIYVTVATTCNC